MRMRKTAIVRQENVRLHIQPIACLLPMSVADCGPYAYSTACRNANLPSTPG